MVSFAIESVNFAFADVEEILRENDSSDSTSESSMVLTAKSLDDSPAANLILDAGGLKSKLEYAVPLAYETLRVCAVETLPVRETKA